MIHKRTNELMLISTLHGCILLKNKYFDLMHTKYEVGRKYRTLALESYNSRKVQICTFAFNISVEDTFDPIDTYTTVVLDYTVPTLINIIQFTTENKSNGGCTSIRIKPMKWSESNGLGNVTNMRLEHVSCDKCLILQNIISDLFPVRYKSPNVVEDVMRNHIICNENMQDIIEGVDPIDTRNLLEDAIEGISDVQMSIVYNT